MENLNRNQWGSRENFVNVADLANLLGVSICVKGRVCFTYNVVGNVVKVSKVARIERGVEGGVARLMEPTPRVFAMAMRRGAGRR